MVTTDHCCLLVRLNAMKPRSKWWRETLPVAPEVNAEGWGAWNAEVAAGIRCAGALENRYDVWVRAVREATAVKGSRRKRANDGQEKIEVNKRQWEK